MVFTKQLECAYCGYMPGPEDLGKACPQCGARKYELVDIKPGGASRQPFLKDARRVQPE